MALLPHKLKHHPALSVFFHSPAHATPAAKQFANAPGVARPLPKRSLRPAFMVFRSLNTTLRRACRARSYRRVASSKRKPAACVYGFPQSQYHSAVKQFAHAPDVARLLPKRSLRPAFMAFRSLNTTLWRSNSRTLLSPRGPFQKEACGPRPRILWPIVPQTSSRCKQTRPALTVGRIPLRRDERAPPSAEGPAPIQNLYSKPHKIHRP